MPNTSVSPLVHSPDEHSIVFMPGTESIDKIIQVQRQLKSLLGDAIWLTPPQALHMTLMEIICDTEYEGMSREEHFRQWYERYNEAAKNAIARFSPIEVTFNRLHASSAAIIITAVDARPFNDIRADLLARTVLPAQTKSPPDIAHCTIARYHESVDLDTVRSLIKGISVEFDEYVSEFRLMKDLGPDFHPITIDTYKLGS
jgi:hypothetical protein